MKDKQPYKQGPITYLTPELMEGYVNHSLPPELMQKVKEFLDKNPFEAEAIEGLKSQSVDLTEEMQDLEGRLSRKLSSGNNRISYFWPAAAAVSLLVVSGVIFYYLMPDSADQVALNQETTEVKTEQLEAVPETDSEIILAEDVSPAPAREIKEETEIIEVPDEEEIEEQIEVNLDVETTAPTINNLAGETQPTKQEFSIEPKLQSNRTEALAVDNIIEKQASIIQEGDITDDRSKAKKAYTPAVIEPTARNYTRSAELPMAEPPEEISDYLKKHTNYPKTAEENGVRGSVAVTFTVNENGGLGDFKIVKKLGFGCDEEAIRTLREGPSWKPAEINGIPIRSYGHIEVEFPP